MARAPRPKMDRPLLILLIAFGATTLATAVIGAVLLYNALFSKNSSGPQPLVKAPEQEVIVPQGAQNQKPLDNSGPSAKAWDGSGRVNVLVMGLDSRDTDPSQASRTDSMILFTMDPASNTAGMLSIPRDLSVNIPGYGEAKLNTAYFLGTIYDTPGGGAALAVKTVEEFLKVPINYYAVINWDAFVKFIDTIGGIDIKLTQEIRVGTVGSGHSIVLKPGTQTLNGATALAYARARDTEHGDFDRAQRQQQVIMAVRDNVLNYYSLPKLVTKAPTLIKTLADGIKTNLSLQDAVLLALEAKKIPANEIQREVINEPDEVTASFNADGQYVLVPIPAEMQKLRNKFFSGASPAPNPAQPQSSSKPAARTPVGAMIVPKNTATPDPKALLRAEGALISIQNGTGRAGLAGSTAEYLKKENINVVEEINADDLYDYSEIRSGGDKPLAVRKLAELLKIPSSRIYNQNIQAGNNANVVIILGVDWANDNPMK